MKLYPFMDRGLASGDLFFDELKDGIYTLNNNLSPITNTPFDYGILIIASGRYGYKAMIAVDVLKCKLFVVSRSERGWNSWVEK